MSEVLLLVSVFLIGIFASVFGTMVGGGTLLSLPLLMLLGLPPQVAVATERFGGLGQTLAAFYKFSRSQKIAWQYVPLLSVISSVGSVIGAYVLVNISPALLHNVIGVILLALLPLTVLKRNLGVKHNQVSGLRIFFGSLIYFLVQIFASFFGGGTGILIAYTLMYCFGLTILEATATKIIPWFFLSLISLFIFAQNGIVNYKLGVVLLVGMTIGGYIGAHLAIKKGDEWVKRVFYFLVMVSVVKLLFF